MQKLWRIVRRDFRQMSRLELLAIALTMVTVPYCLNAQGWSWKATAGVPLVLVFGYMAGSMICELWFPRRR